MELTFDDNLSRIPAPDYAHHPAYGTHFGKPSLRARYTALRYIAPYLMKSYKDYLQWKRAYRRHRGFQASLTESSQAKLAELRRYGAIGFPLTPEQIETVLQLTRPIFDNLEVRRRQKAKRVFQDNSIPVKDRATIEFLEKIFTENGYLPVASAYMGMPLKISKMFGLVYSPEDTSFWKKSFEGTSLTSPSTTYMHIDSRFGALKFLLYLNEVTEENGPFCYVLGSQSFRRGPGELVIRKAMDISRLDSIMVEKRELFWALPRFLRKKCAFGYDLPDGTAASEALLGREKRFTSQEGNLILFDYNGIHRGGMVRSGERRILQIQVTPVDGGIS